MTEYSGPRPCLGHAENGHILLDVALDDALHHWVVGYRAALPEWILRPEHMFTPIADTRGEYEELLAALRAGAAGEMLDIELLDHIIVGHQRFVSLKERGLGF